MNGAIIAQLLIKLGPIAFDLAEKLAAIWSKEMTPQEVAAFCQANRKSYDDYIAAERAARTTANVT
jgi:hypothetical protein